MATARVLITMRQTRLLLGLLFALSAVAQEPSPGISPAQGHSLGGDEVIITSHFVYAGGDPDIYFGPVKASRVEWIAEKTLRVTTPPHPPGKVRVFYDASFRGMGLLGEFTFVGPVPPVYERVLLPVIGPPVRGANGSEFRTDLRVANTNKGWEWLPVIGLAHPPYLNCRGCLDDLRLPPAQVFSGQFPEYSANIDYDRTRQFLFIPRTLSENFLAQLRVYDVSRDATNYGTEIPIVRERDMFAASESLVLMGIPSDSRFRTALRIYSTAVATGFDVSITSDSGHVEERSVAVRGDDSLTHPATAALFDLPVDVGTLRITLTPWPSEDHSFWAFITVTNNETQHITVVSPQR